LFLSTVAVSQTPGGKDTTSRARDSIKTDSTHVAKDTTSSSGVDTVVAYTCADSITYFVNTRIMTMYARGDVKYRQMELTAERIDVDWNTTVMNAHGVVDTSDTTGKKNPKAIIRYDSLGRKLRGTPIMKDGGETYDARELSYNFKTKKGKLIVGDTKVEQGYYHGEDIKKVDKNVLFVQNGRYTTCDKPDPDFYFACPEMEIITGEEIVAEPVYLYIGDVPIFALPFAIFPDKGGRRSGIIPPAYGEDPQAGKFLRRLGYYWAISDYMDLSTTTDLYTEGGFTLDSKYTYNMRYYFNGGITGEYRYISTGEDSDPNRVRDKAYNVNISHHQTIDPTSNLNVDFTFASDNNYENTLNLAQALAQTITSNAAYEKSWEGTMNSMSVTISRRQNLTDKSSYTTLPSIAFTHSQTYPFRKESSSDQSSDLSWYENIGMSYSVNASNSLNTISEQVSGVKAFAGDTATQTLTEFEKDRAQTVNSAIDFTISPKLGYFTITPQVQYNDARSFADNTVPGLNADSTLMYADEKSSDRLGTLTAGVGASTRLYGIVQPNIFGIAAIRHTLEPTLSLNYVKNIIDTGWTKRQMLLALSLTNIFEMKTIPSEEGKEGQKINLMNVGLGLSYDLAADSMNLSDLTMNARTTVGNLLNIGGSADYDLYKFVLLPSGSYGNINQLYLKDGHLARLRSFDFSVSSSLAGEAKQSPNTSEVPTNPQQDTVGQHHMKTGILGIYDNEEPNFNIPWTLSLGFDFDETKDPPTPTRSVNMRGDLSFNLTQNWKFQAQASYDILNRQVGAPQITINRDLHCWVMDFSWVPIGNYRNYQFNIHIKAPQLQDIKLTKSGSDYDLR
jgi:hypothetical protein